MRNEVLDVSNIYKAICLASLRGKKLGMSVGELKKEYKMKARDIKSLLSFLQNYETKDNFYIQFEVYKFSPETISINGIYNSTYEELVDYLEEVDLEHDELTDNVFIRIPDKPYILGEKINENSIDLRNASLTNSIYNIGEIWNKISDVQIGEDYIGKDYILIKENRNQIANEKEINRRNWINGIVKRREANIEYKTGNGRINQKTILPIGMYYNKFTACHICVYFEKPYEAMKDGEINLDELVSVNILTNEISYNIEFNIDEYITSKQEDKIVLYVFHEGNVGEKLKNLLADNQLNIEYGEEYDVFTFMTEDVWQYIKIIKSYGRSVVVAEPEEIREEIIDNIDKTLSIYKATNAVYPNT